MFCCLSSGKYPHLLVAGGSTATDDAPDNETVLNFAHVAVGRHSEKWIELKNLSPVSIAIVPLQPVENTFVISIRHN